MTKKSTEARYSLLKLESKDGPIYFVMKEFCAQDETEELTRYFYEEHSCPTNWLRQCVMVAQDGDTDPHGFMTYVRSAKTDGWIIKDGDAEEFNEDYDAHVATLFPEILEKW